MNKIIKFAIALFAIISIQTSALAAKTAQQPEELDKVVAIVNKEVIPESELNHQEALVKRNLEKSKTKLPDEKIFRKQVLESLINQKLEMQMAKRLGIEVDQTKLDNAINNVAKRNKMTIAQFQKSLEKKGIDFAYYRQQVKEQLTLNQLLEREVSSRIYISPQEVNNIMNSEAYEQTNRAEYHLEDILISLPDVPSSSDVHTALQKANKIMTDLKNGKDFKQIAIAESNGQEALKGGDLGWRPLEELPEVFAVKVKTMKPGEYAGPIRTPNGYHIIKLIETKGLATQHYITETNVRHILLIKNAINTDTEIQAKLKKYRKEIKNGASFAKLAEKYSQDPVSAAKGGSLGWVKPGFLTPPFQKAMDQLKPGQLSEPVESKFGWHLIQVQGRKKVNDTKEWQKNQIRQMIFERKFNQKVQNWVNEMRQASYIKIIDKNL